MSKTTTYQRMKAEIKELERQLLIVTQRPSSSEANLITMQWRMRADMDSALWYGNSSNEIQKIKQQL